MKQQKHGQDCVAARWKSSKGISVKDESAKGMRRGIAALLCLWIVLTATLAAVEKQTATLVAVARQTEIPTTAEGLPETLASTERQTDTPTTGTRLRVMSWNVENLFDTVHDEGFSDEEFLPGSPRRWTSRRYRQKLSDIAQVVATVSGDGGMVDLLGLCEVENDSVLTMLTRRSPLRQLGYRYVMTHCRDRRGIDVALLYQPARFKLLEYRSVATGSEQYGLRPTRDLLYAKGLVRRAMGIDTLHVVVVHLPSRAGGMDGDKNRRIAAQRLWQLTDSIDGSGGMIVVMGDFNAGGSDVIFRGKGRLRLTDSKTGRGTYSFRGYWQWLDHILVSETMGAVGPAETVAYPWLLEENKTYGGDMPRRTFRGPTYHGGVSDHLPVVLDIDM